MSERDGSSGAAFWEDADDTEALQRCRSLMNAIEYAGDGPAHTQISAERKADEWIISVHDEGIGTDPDDAGRLFEAFQSLHGQSDHSGTGIGLALCERIVERHDGEIWVESEPGEGGDVLVHTADEGANDE